MEKFAQIPRELKRLKQWVCWDRINDPQRPDKPKKVPLDPRTGMSAKSNDPGTWCEFEICAREAGKYAGIGFMFANGYFGVDLDGVEMDSEIVREFLTALNSYAERSQSGRGLHIVCRGTLPPRGRRRGNVEMYESGRFFVMTGERIGDYAEIAEGTEAIKALHAKYIGAGEATEKPAARIAPGTLNEAEILDVATRARNGDKFRALWAGSWQGAYGSHSEADMALCGMLMFYARGDVELVDAMFRRSGLMRPKWDERDYGSNTLVKAKSNCTAYYEPPEPARKGFTISPTAQITLHTLDDMGNARRLVEAAPDGIRYDYVDKFWLVYDGRRWQQDLRGEVPALTDGVPPRIARELAVLQENPAKGSDVEDEYHKFMRRSRSNSAKKAMIAEAEHLVPVEPHELDAHPELLNTPTCVIDCKSGGTQRHSHAYYLTRITNARYEETAVCPRWEAFLAEIFAGDQELIRYVQKAVGYSLTGSTQEQCVFFLYGDGANGKSTFLDTIAHVLGDYAMNVQPTTLTEKKGQSGGGANSDIARLKGARFVTSVEPNEGMRLDEGLIKQLTGGDTITARRQYGQEFEFRAEFKIWMGTNHKPVIRGTDTGVWRRIHLVPFVVQIPKARRDPYLGHKLRSEADGILRWAVAGCALWRKEGLDQPAAVREATSEYKGEMDIVQQFLSERTVASSYGRVGAAQLYKAYVEWATAGNEFKMTATRFGREVKKHVQAIKGRATTDYVGIALAD